MVAVVADGHVLVVHGGHLATGCMGWDGMGWDGMGWDGMGWVGVGRGGAGESSQSLLGRRVGVWVGQAVESGEGR